VFPATRRRRQPMLTSRANFRVGALFQQRRQLRSG
jgi:hypothetical protein